MDRDEVLVHVKSGLFWKFWTAFRNASSSGVFTLPKRVFHSERKRSIWRRLKTVSP